MSAERAGQAAESEPSPADVQHGAPEPVLGMPAERADALLPADLIQGGEIIILLLKPSPWFIILGCLEALGIIAVVTLGPLAVDRWLGLGSFNEEDLLTLAITLGALRIGWQFLEWLSRVYVLTDRRIIRVRGVLRVEVFQARLSRIQHTEVLFSVRERLFGLGTIAFSTAGTRHPAAYWLMLRRPLAVHQEVLRALHRYGRK